MPSQSFDVKVYISAYAGIGKEGRAIADTLRARARKNGMSMSEFLVKAGLSYGKADTQTSKADTYKRKADTRIKAELETLPPSLRQPTRPPARAARLRDDEEGIPPPKIDEPAPSSKPPTLEYVD